ncbi:MAG: asparagine synthase (glutamine-hydrolyzing) [Thermaerobacter sp.]|nr:asparagine synthase (glutamine-hydrolyzing) [Thermaerobacter sp.]
MCGIAGMVDLDGRAEPVQALEQMLESLRHRGPDDLGTYSGQGIALGMRRLAIVDPAGGIQPFYSENRRIVAVVNGEIYNHVELRRRLEAKGHAFRGGSDAEVVVHLYEEHGAKFPAELRGMFAVALWDCGTHRLLLARDPVGIKPLLWRRTRHGFAFASELRSLLHVDSAPALNLAAIDRYLLYRTAVGEETVVEGIHRVLPGHTIEIDAAGTMRRAVFAVATSANAPQEIIDPVSELDRRMAESVRTHLQGDQPIGVLLSGGIDSGLVLHYAAQEMQGLHAYTAGFVGFGDEGQEFDVTSATAAAYGVPLHRLEITPEEAERHLLALTHEVDEPNGDPTALPLRAVAERAAQDVPVVLSGEGADELFAGYPGYYEPLVVERFQRSVPQGLRRALAHLPLAVPGRGFAQRSLTPLGKRYLGIGMSWTGENRLRLYAPEVREELIDASPDSLAREAFEEAERGGADWLGAMLHVDRTVWLADEALLKLDRLTMTFGLEARVPYLDAGVIDLADRLPWQRKLEGGQGKWVLRQVAHRHLPAEVASRRKRGFPSPISRLLAGPLRDLAFDFLTDDTAQARGLFETQTVAQVLNGLRARPNGSGRLIYVLLALELWLRQVYDMAPGVASEQQPKREFGA